MMYISRFIAASLPLLYTTKPQKPQKEERGKRKQEYLIFLFKLIKIKILTHCIQGQSDISGIVDI